MVQCNSVKDLIFFYLVWIDRDDYTLSKALLTVSLILVVHAGATIARLFTKTIGANEIHHLICMIMIFPLPIFKEVREFLRLIPVKDALFDEGPPSDPESNSTSSTCFSVYKKDDVLSMLYFVDKDALVCAA